jgi:carbonic anhydrase/acetyltransferase-like protein (isoleucine patch superfamily)
MALSSYPKSQYSCVAASTGPTTVLPSERVLFKRCKIDVEDDLNKTGQTPKLIVSKSILRNAASHIIRVRTDLDDIHLYAIAPWVIRLIQVRTDLSSIQKEVIPLLTARQFKGVQAAFGSNIHNYSKEKLEVVKTYLPALWETVKSVSYGNTHPNRVFEDVDEQNEQDDTAHYEDEDNTYVVGGQGVDDIEREKKRVHPLMYHVAAVVLPRGQRLVLRASTINHYLYACRELVAHALRAPTKEEMVLLTLPNSTQNTTATPLSPSAEEALYTAVGSTFAPLQGTISSKFSTLILPDASIGEKATLKSCTVGRHCKIGNKCRLNNVVIMDHATIGDNCVLQNSIVGEYVVIGDNCNFNDVQVGPGAIVRSGTKCKNESISSGEKNGSSAALVADGHSDDEGDSFSDNL